MTPGWIGLTSVPASKIGAGELVLLLSSVTSSLLNVPVSLPASRTGGVGGLTVGAAVLIVTVTPLLARLTFPERSTCLTV